jgi:hypothetical protein
MCSTITQHDAQQPSGCAQQGSKQLYLADTTGMRLDLDNVDWPLPQVLLPIVERDSTVHDHDDLARPCCKGKTCMIMQSVDALLLLLLLLLCQELGNPTCEGGKAKDPKQVLGTVLQKLADEMNGLGDYKV